jgi:hypothetical protein
MINLILHALDDVQVPPWWCSGNRWAWARLVDRWLDPKWDKLHLECWERHLKMLSPAHHQGNLNLRQFAARWL